MITPTFQEELDQAAQKTRNESALKAQSSIAMALLLRVNASVSMYHEDASQRIEDYERFVSAWKQHMEMMKK